METSWRGTVRALLRSPLPPFLALSLFLLVVHEPWRDEAQPWLIVRDAPHLFFEMDSEGTPALWYALLLPLVELGLPFTAARVLHVALAAVALSVFLLHAPFGRAAKWIFAFGYFVAYEYNAVTRSYVLVLLLLFLLAAFHRERNGRPLRHGLVLFLLANATAHGAILALIFAGAWGLESLFRRPFPWRAMVGAALGVLGAGLAVLQMLPREDVALWRTYSNREWAEPHLVEAARGLLHALLPVPQLQEWTWGATWLDATLSGREILALGVVVYALSWAAFLHRPRVLLLWAGGSLALMGVYYLKHGVSGQLRHHGILFALFVFCLWLARVEPGPRPPRPWRALGAAALALLLVVHAAATVPAVLKDAREPFSGGPGAAAWLRGEGPPPEGTLLAAYPSFIAASVLVHVEDLYRTAYVPQTDQHLSYVRWTHEDAAGFHMDHEALVARVDAEAQRTGAQRVVLLLTFPMSAPWFDDRYALAYSEGSVSPGDATYVYISTCPCGTQSAAS